MNWYQKNRWLGNFLIAFAAALLLGLWFCSHTKDSFADAMTEFNAAATEHSRLEHLIPLPNEGNVKKTRLELENYEVRLNALKGEVSALVLAPAAMAPNEFQTHLRQAILNTSERARANRVKLPENFHLGFDEFATSLPVTTDAPVLDQELQQIELLAGILIEAKVDAIANVKLEARSSATEAAPSAAPIGPTPAAKKVVERATVNLTFTASPSATRNVLNQVASSDRQFFIIRTLYVRNEQPKGPSREQTAATATTVTTSPATLKFIVGNEHVESTVRVELVRFSF